MASGGFSVVPPDVALRLPDLHRTYPSAALRAGWGTQLCFAAPRLGWVASGARFDGEVELKPTRRSRPMRERIAPVSGSAVRLKEA